MPLPSPVHMRSMNDILEEMVPSSVRPKKVIHKKKRSKKPSRRSQQQYQEMPLDSGDEQMEGEEEIIEYEHTTYNHVMKTSKKLHDEEGVCLNILEVDSIPTVSLEDEDCPSEHEEDGKPECVGCSWFFLERRQDTNDIRINGIEPINKIIAQLVTQVHIDELSKIVHTFYMKHIYYPLFHSGMKDVPVWYSKHIKEHILGHTKNPVVISDYMTKLIISNINALQYCKWKKNKNDVKDIKPDYEALKEEREQIKMYTMLSDKTKKERGQTNVGKILEELGMGINKF